jgi:hypothetical protein
MSLMYLSLIYYLNKLVVLLGYVNSGIN